MQQWEKQDNNNKKKIKDGTDQDKNNARFGHCLEFQSRHITLADRLCESLRNRINLRGLFLELDTEATSLFGCALEPRHNPVELHLRAVSFGGDVTQTADGNVGLGANG